MFRRLLFVLTLTLLFAWTFALPACANAPLRLNCGSGITAGSFSPDNYYSSFAPASTTASIDIKGVPGAAPSLVYQTQNSAAATLTYTLPGFTPSTVYVVRLHFAEIVLNASGQRKMNVSINGATVLTNFDIFATAGAKNRAVIQAFNATADSAGKITIAFAAQTGSACVSGIEVVLPALLPNDNPPPGWAGGVTPMSGGGSGGMGPTSADGVNLASGVYENNPGADLDAYNPVGPSPVFARMYRSKNAAVGYASPAWRRDGRTTTTSRCWRNSAKQGLCCLVTPAARPSNGLSAGGARSAAAWP